MSDPLSSRIDRYQIQERIGAGGMARVYKAWDTKLERLVAVKVLHEHLADDASFRVRFEREAKIVAAFDHPNIVHLFDYSMVDRSGEPLCYMVMSYIPGKTLRQVMEESNQGQHLTGTAILSITDDVLAALGYAHQHGMAHRDVKPGNILIAENGRAVLTDFGIARLVEGSRLTQEGQSTGTPAYMSPEQAAGEPGDTRSDLYSLAIIVYELVSGAPPFADEGSLAVMLKHINDPVPALNAPAGVSGAKLNAFMQRALAKNPNDRFQTSDDFGRALHQVFRPEVTTAEMAASLVTVPEGPTEVVPSVTRSAVQSAGSPAPSAAAPRRRMWPFWAGAALLIVLIALTAAAIARTPVDVPAATSAATVTPVIALAENNLDSFRSRFDGRDDSDALWPLLSDGPFTSTIADGALHIVSARPDNASALVYGGGNAFDDVSITMEGVIAPESHPFSALGIVFRYRDEGNYNVFAVDASGRFSIWTRENGEWTELRRQEDRWTSSDSVATAGQSNLLTLDVIGDRLTGYVNNDRVVRLSDDTFDAGSVGIYIGSDAGPAEFAVDRYQVYPSVPSMTGQ